MTMQYWSVFWMFLTGATVLGARAAVASWGRPERFDASWAWTRPAPVRLGWHGPLRPAPQVVNVGAGADENWSPIVEGWELVQKRLPLDDVEEWLAGRLSEYDHALMRIDHELGSEVDVELAAFQRGSLGLRAYRSMILDSTGGYGPREHMQLEALLAGA